MYNIVIPVSLTGVLVFVYHLIRTPLLLKIEELESKRDQRSEGKSVQQAEFEAWVGRKKLHLAYAACLLSGVRPERPPLSSQYAQAMLDELCEAVNDGVLLTATWGKAYAGLRLIFPGVSPQMEVIRIADLVQFFESGNREIPEYLKLWCARQDANQRS